ncbi:MAG TPA: DUF1501 domain-containing protein [Dehalococcoidia bacterium]|nr:DUF1501 domain-containing protein [Dehalococcoidia bacterium]
MLTRRSFIQGSALVSLGALVPPIFRQAAAVRLLDGVAYAATLTRTLIIVQLAGGNDGLNTVVPLADGAYRSARPKLAVPEDTVLRLNERAGLHPNLAPLLPLWQAGQLAIVEGVGYPNPNLSHFVSMHVWQTADPEGKARDGWAGRYLADIEKQQHDPFHGFNVGTGMAPEMNANGTASIAANSAEDYSLQTGSRDPADDQKREQTLLKLYESYPREASYGALLETTVEDAMQSSQKVQDVSSAYKPAVTYPADRLGSALQFLASVVVSGQEVRVGHVTLGGFDTHSQQAADHDALLTSVANGLTALQQDLEAHGKADDVVVMTWSEFGRRPGENASAGTDHGTAAPLFVLGKPVKGGFYGEPPSLTKLDTNGNLQFITDFRSVYATLLEKWLQADSRTLLGAQYPQLAFL